MKKDDPISVFQKDVQSVDKAIEALRQKNTNLLKSFLKKMDLSDLKFVLTNEYDDQNYYDWIRPYTLGGAEFDISELEDTDPNEFERLVLEILKHELQYMESDEAGDKLKIDDDMKKHIPLAQEIARRGMDPKKTLEAIFAIRDLVPNDCIPKDLIEYG